MDGLPFGVSSDSDRLKAAESPADTDEALTSCTGHHPWQALAARTFLPQPPAPRRFFFFIMLCVFVAAAEKGASRRIGLVERNLGFCIGISDWNVHTDDGFAFRNRDYPRRRRAAGIRFIRLPLRFSFGFGFHWRQLRLLSRTQRTVIIRRPSLILIKNNIISAYPGSRINRIHLLKPYRASRQRWLLFTFLLDLLHFRVARPASLFWSSRASVPPHRMKPTTFRPFARLRGSTSSDLLGLPFFLGSGSLIFKPARPASLPGPELRIILVGRNGRLSGLARTSRFIICLHRFSFLSVASPRTGRGRSRLRGAFHRLHHDLLTLASFGAVYDVKATTTRTLSVVCADE